MSLELPRRIAQLNFLVAEDHEFQRNMLAWMLAGLGATQVYEAGNGHTALSLIQDKSVRVDIVISDLDMPGMDGLEFVGHLGRAGNQVSIILASALEPSVLAAIKPMAEAYGINLLGVIEKPLTPEKLLRLIERHESVVEVPTAGVRPDFSIAEIRDALLNDQFQPYFQPKVDIRSGRLCGAEALARWHHPDHGQIGPALFVDALEDAGYVDELTWEMMRKSVVACSQWEASAHLDVSVNVSVKSLHEARFAERLMHLVTSFGVQPGRLIVELTESAATVDVGHVLQTLVRLRMYGFGLSIDDFGRGYSSIHQLTRIPFTELKIDHTFVQAASHTEAARIILESSIDLAKRLGLVSVGEGVESREDLDTLRELDCDMAQGYLIARPMPAEAWMDWVSAWDPNGLGGVSRFG